MKKLKLLLVVNLLILAISSPSLISQNAFQYLRQSVIKTIIVSGLQYGYEFNDSSCIAGILLKNGESGAIGIYLNRQNEYRIIGVADENVLDLDVHIEDSQGKVIVQDTQNDNLPLINYKPSISGYHVIRIKNYRSTSVSFCILFILKKRPGSSTTPPSIKLLTQALDNSITLSELYSLTGTSFIPKTFCLFGGFYKSGEADGMSDFQIPYGQDGKYVFLSAGSNNVDDVDVKVIKQSKEGTISGLTICQDNSTSKMAIVSCNLLNSNYYYLEYKNYKSTDRAFIIGVVMKEGYLGTNTNQVSTNDNKNEKSDLKNIFDYLSPDFSYSKIYFGRPLFKDGIDISFSQFNVSSHFFSGIRLSWGILSSKNGDNVGYVGILLRGYWAKFAYNLDQNRLFFPSWIAGFHWKNDFSILDLASGQIKILQKESEMKQIGGITYEIPKYVPIKTFFIHLKYEFYLMKPIWFHFSGNYPFRNGGEYYQIGIGFSLRL